MRWTATIAARHLVELPVRFRPKPPQDVTQQPSLRPPLAQRSDWEITTSSAARAAAATPQSLPAPPPRPSAAVPRAPEPATLPSPRTGPWRRVLRWWRRR